MDVQYQIFSETAQESKCFALVLPHVQISSKQTAVVTFQKRIQITTYIGSMTNTFKQKVVKRLMKKYT